MGGWAMVRNAAKQDRVELARRLLNRYWKHLTVRQVNRLSRYVKMFG